MSGDTRAMTGELIRTGSACSDRSDREKEQDRTGRYEHSPYKQAIQNRTRKT